MGGGRRGTREGERFGQKIAMIITMNETRVREGGGPERGDASEVIGGWLIGVYTGESYTSREISAISCVCVLGWPCLFPNYWIVDILKHILNK